MHDGTPPVCEKLDEPLGGFVRIGKPLAIASLLLAITSCVPVPDPAKAPPGEQSKADPVKVAELRKRLLDAMIQERTCFQSNLDYAVRDQEYLDAVLARLLGRATLEELVGNDREIANLEREAPLIYSGQLSTPDGLARLERVIAERFAHPVVTTIGKQVTADYGHIAARLSVGGRKKIGILFSESPHLDHREWRSQEVAAALKELQSQYLQAREVRVRVLIPEALIANEWIYTFYPKDDRVMITFPAAGRRPLLTPEMGHTWAPYLDGTKSLQTSTLREINPAIMQPLGGANPPVRQ